MKNITSGRIDEAVYNAHSLMCENLESNFGGNFESFKKIYEEDNIFSNETEKMLASLYLAVIKTLQDGCIIALDKTLKELLCD